MSPDGKIRIQQFKSGIATPVKHKKILRALGLGKLNRIVELPDHPGVRGMVAKISHLVRIVDGGAQ